MSMSQRELELKDRIIRNTAKSLQWADKVKKEEKLALTDFMHEIGKVFIYIVGSNERKEIVLTYVSEDFEREQELLDKKKDRTEEEEKKLVKMKDTLYVNINFLISAEDATPRSSYFAKILLSHWISLLIDRLRSRTRNKRTISLIITEMFLQFMQCYSEHRRKTYAIYDLLMMSVEAMSTQASAALFSFLETDAASAFQDAKKNAERSRSKAEKTMAAI